MIVELERIAEKKIEQVGGTPCGVIVRNEAGALLAVTDLGRVTWLDDCVAGPVGHIPDATKMVDPAGTKPACNCPVRSGAHDHDCPVHWFEWSQHLDRQLEEAKARVSGLEAALKEARANLHEWSGCVPEYFQEKHGLEQDLAAIDRVLGAE